MEIASPPERVLIDFTLKEVVSIGGDPGGKYLLLRLVPDERSWKRAELHEVQWYSNRFDDVFISDENLARSLDGIACVSICLNLKEVESEQEYIKKSRKRVGKGKT